MSIHDTLGTTNLDLVTQVAQMDTALANRFTQTRPSLANFIEFGMSRDDFAVINSPTTPPGGICGAGVVHLGDSWRPAIFALMRMMTLPIEFWAPASLSPVQRITQSLMGSVPMPAGTVFIGLPPVLNFAVASPWTEVEADGQRCTLGVHVSLPNGRRAITTAGHGAPTIGRKVLLGGDVIGTVVWSRCRELTVGPTAVADLAVVALEDPVVEANLVQVYTRPPLPQEIITIPKPGSVKSGRVWGLSDTFAPDEYAPWGDVLICSAMSKPGDSGGAVLGDDGACLGHVVGGAIDYMTVVQQLNYQLSAARVALR